MAVLKPRTRVVFFRVSQEEFQEFMQACESSGARSASDFVRLAIQRMIAANSEPVSAAPASPQASQVDAMLEQLAARVDRLDETIREHFGKQDSGRAGREVGKGAAYDEGVSTTTIPFVANATGVAPGLAPDYSPNGSMISAVKADEFQERHFAIESE